MKIKGNTACIAMEVFHIQVVWHDTCQCSARGNYLGGMATDQQRHVLLMPTCSLKLLIDILNNQIEGSFDPVVQFQYPLALLLWH